MTKNKTLTPKQILLALQTKTLLGELQGRDYHHDDDIARADAEQLILQWVADTFDMSELDDVYAKYDTARGAVTQAKANYESQRRQILKAAGWKQEENKD